MTQSVVVDTVPPAVYQFTDAASNTQAAYKTLTRTGYSLKGWSTSSTATSATYNAGANITSLTANQVLYAVWDGNSITINYKKRTTETTEVLPTTTDSAKVGTAKALASNPTRDGYTFAGWEYTPNASGAPITIPASTSYTFDGNTPANIDLTAVWTANTYTVLFDGNGGTVGGSYTYTNPALTFGWNDPKIGRAHV